MITLRSYVTALTVAVSALLGWNANAAEPQTPTTQVLHRTVKIDGLDIFYREAGSKDAPAVLLLHGFPTSVPRWDFVSLRSTRSGWKR